MALVSGNACTFTFLIQRILRIVKNFEFADGTVITSNELFSTPLTITSNSEIKNFSYEFRRREANLFKSDKDDNLYGYSENDTLESGKGDDYLAGGNGTMFIFLV